MEVPNEAVNMRKNISYLRARDPSILTGNFPLANVKTNLNTQWEENTTRLMTLSEEDNHLKVYLRIKNCQHFEDLYEITDDTTLLCKVPEGAHCIRNIRDGSCITKTFTFSKIFGSESTQGDLFNGIVKKKVLNFINGYNCSLLTYGASGSGKTFTIVGTANEPGIIPRALEYLFRTLPKLPDQPQNKPTASGNIVHLSSADCELEKSIRQNLLKDPNINIDRMQHAKTYKAMQERLSEEPVAVILDDISHVSISVWVSFAEIYNEYVYDLLSPEPRRGQMRQKLRVGYLSSGAYIKDLKCVNVTSGMQAYHILQYGLHNLKYASTSLNDHSSRSHSIFTIKLVQASSKREGFNVSAFNFCDLAGSERVKKTHNVGDRLKESNNINTSLLVLGRCVSMVREAQKHNDNRLIPFRESKLTQLFQRALQGHECIAMIVNINPIREMFDETHHVLNFSAIAKDVIIEEQQLVKVPSNNRFSQYLENENEHLPIIHQESYQIEELQEQIEALYSELQQQKLDAQEERERIINGYKDLLSESTKSWEDHCRELQNKLMQYMRSVNNAEQSRPKKRKTSVITLDSSSDEDDNESSKKCNKCKCPSNYLTESSQLKLQLEAVNLEAQKLESVNKSLKSTIDTKVKMLELENKSLKETLEDAKKAYLELQSNYKESNLEIIRKQEKINELNSYLEAFSQNKIIIAQQESENCSLDSSQKNGTANLIDEENELERNKIQTNSNCKSGAFLADVAEEEEEDKENNSCNIPKTIVYSPNNTKKQAYIEQTSSQRISDIDIENEGKSETGDFVQ